MAVSTSQVSLEGLGLKEAALVEDAKQEGFRGVHASVILAFVAAAVVSGQLFGGGGAAGMGSAEVGKSANQAASTRQVGYWCGEAEAGVILCGEAEAGGVFNLTDEADEDDESLVEFDETLMCLCLVKNHQSVMP